MTEILSYSSKESKKDTKISFDGKSISNIDDLDKYYEKRS